MEDGRREKRAERRDSTSARALTGWIESRWGMWCPGWTFSGPDHPDCNARFRRDQFGGGTDILCMVLACASRWKEMSIATQIGEALPFTVLSPSVLCP